MNKQVTSFLVAIATVSATCLLATNSVQGADVLSPSQMKAQLTSQDIKEATPTAPKKAGTDDIGMPIDSTKSAFRAEPRASYPNVNSYILQNNYQHPNITKELHQFEMFGYKTNDGLPSGVAVHYTANPNSFTAREGADFEINGGWESAFVHTFIDAQNILNIHDTDYGAWGSGRYGNKYFVQFEMVTARNFADFAKTTSYSAWYTAYLLHQYNLTPSLAQAHNGVGTVWSHSDITHYLGGTDHTDPDAYFAMYGYNMQQFFALVQHYYGQMNETVTQRQNVSLKGHVNGGQSMYWLESKGLVNSGSMTNQLSNKKVTVTQWIKTSLNKEYYLATVDGKAIAWVPKDSFEKNELVVTQKDINLSGTITNGKATYWLTNVGMVSAH